jgi:uncharacterized coiled-coil protein SlyX
MPFMPALWVQIVRLMPSILEVSQELLKRTRRQSPASTSTESGRIGAGLTLEARISSLEENECRQAELVTTMADQLAQLTTAVTALHAQTRRLVFVQVATSLVAVIALVLVLV